MSTKLKADAYTNRFSKWLTDPITDDEREAAEAWYEYAYSYADRLGERLEADAVTGACVLSAFSIRTKWLANINDAFAYAEGKDVPGLSIRKTLADAALVHGFDAFRAPKTNAFARAIAGDKDAVVLDVWMCKAARIGRDSPSTVQYRNMAKAIKILAKRHDMTPRGMQALIWGRVRGSLA